MICALCHMDTGAPGWLRRDDISPGQQGFGQWGVHYIQCTHNSELVTAQFVMRSNLRGSDLGLSVSGILDIPGRDGLFDYLALMLGRKAGVFGVQGGFGCGKTHILKTVVAEMVRARTPAMYQNLPDLLGRFREAYNPERPRPVREFFDQTLDVPVLALDEIDKARLTDWARETVFRVVDFRYTHRDRLLTVAAWNDDAGVEGYLLSRFGRNTMRITGGDIRPYIAEEDE